MPASEKQGFQVPHITRIEPISSGFAGSCSCGIWKPETFRDKQKALSAAYIHRMANK